MSKLKHSLFVAALMTVASVTTVPAYANGDKPAGRPAQTETGEHADKAKLSCTPDELRAFLAAQRAEQAAKAKREAAEKKVSKHDGDRNLRAEGSPVPESESDAAREAAKAAKRAAEKKAEAAHKAEKEKARAAEEKARALKKAAQACSTAKQEAAKRAKKEADRKARARRFQAIGVVVSADAEAGTVTVMVKAGSPDLHKRKLAIRVTTETVIRLDGEKVTLSALATGTFVSIHGVRHEGALVAGKINAASPGVQEEEPVSTASPSASPTDAD